MGLSISYQLRILKEIRRINCINDNGQKLDEFIFAKEKFHGELNDEMDELFAGVDLSNTLTAKAKKEQDKLTAKDIINGLSIIASKEEQDVYDFNEMFDFMEEAIEQLYWYDQQLLRVYLKVGNFRAMEKETGIPWESCYKTVIKVIDKIREEAKQKNIEFNVRKKKK